MKKRALIINFAAVGYLESFMVAAIASILAIRLFLELTGYPQIGGAGLHVAHVLWGGLLMLAANVILLSFIGKAAQTFGAIVGGVGFGMFIDEVGKFVTSDNNYFFRPAVALMYGVFILLFLALRAIHSRREYSSAEYLVNALREMEEVARVDLDEEEKGRSLKYLEQSDAGMPLVAALKDALARTPSAAEPRAPRLFTRLKLLGRRFYDWVASRRWFARLLVLFFLAQLVVKFLYVFVLIFFVGLRWEQILDYSIVGRVAGQMRNLSFMDWAEVISSLLSGLFVLLGVWRLRRSRLAAYRMFERSILVSIFLTQFFAFYKEQCSALLGLLLNVGVLLALRFMIEREKDLLLKEPAAG